MTAKSSRRAAGARREELTAKYLELQGYQILEQNFFSRYGEIDLIARDGDTLVFVEVKYRSNTAAGDPAEAVTAQKQERIRKTARYYLCVHQISENLPCRFDVAAILGSQIRLIKNAF